MQKVRLKSGTEFMVSEGKTILDEAIEQGVVLPYSCLTGRCGTCKCKVISGETTILNAETSLSVHETNSSFVLTCCRVAVSDVELDIEDLPQLKHIRSKTTPCKITSITQCAEDVIEVKLRTPPSGKLIYLPGQYVNIIGPENISRSYSIANSPSSDGHITLQIRRVDNGKLSQYWFKDAKVDDLLRMEGPLGTFFVRDSDKTNIIFLATGTGIAPIKAMLESLSKEAELMKDKKIFLFWGNRYSEDFYWEPRFKNLHIEYMPVMSRDTKAKDKPNYVQDMLLDLNLDLKNAIVYSCGAEKMIEDARNKLLKRGLPSDFYHSDAFVSSS